MKNELPISIILPIDFLKEETRNGYLISRNMKELWAIELDLLSQFDSVCKKYNIPYFASGGTMLGAARHNGFIPWDDDIDLMLFRNDYEKLCEVAPKEFKQPYFFQTEYTDPGSTRRHAQLRNSYTTGILKEEVNLHLPFNQGVFIDIFPLDAVPDDEKKFKKQQKKINKLIRKIGQIKNLYNPDNPTLKDRIVILRNSLINKLYNGDYLSLYQKLESVCSKYNDEDTKMVSLLSFSTSNPRRCRADFKETIELDFEFLKIPVPKNYKNNLTRVYGDWKKFVIGGQFHGGIIFRSDISYKDYFKQIAFKNEIL